MCACAIFVKQCTTSNHTLESRRSAIHFRNSLLPHYYSIQDSLDSRVQHIMERLEMKRQPQKLGFTSVVDCNTQRSIYYFSICITFCIKSRNAPSHTLDQNKTHTTRNIKLGFLHSHRAAIFKILLTAFWKNINHIRMSNLSFNNRINTNSISSEYELHQSGSTLKWSVDAEL